MLTPERSDLLKRQKYKTNKKKNSRQKTRQKNKHIKVLKLIYLKVKVKYKANNE